MGFIFDSFFLFEKNKVMRTAQVNTVFIVMKRNSKHMWKYDTKCNLKPQG